MTEPGGPVLYYDGECGVCTRSVRLVLQHDRRGTLRFASLRGEHGAALVARHPELRGMDSIFWVEPALAGVAELVLARSEAVLAVARYLGGWWRLASVLRVIPKGLRDAGYSWFARRRGRFGKPDSCRVPTPAERGRFLDLG